jgi:hypothetical protein
MIAMIWFLTVMLASLGGLLPTASVLTSYWLYLCCKPTFHLRAKSQLKEPSFYDDWPESPLKSYASFVHKLIKLHYWIANEPIHIVIHQGK